MRGKVSGYRPVGGIFGITPAYAGKRFPLDTLSGVYAGSPPPMRGKEFLWIMPTPVFRITPAYAGKSESFNDILYTLRDHPRLCGEKIHICIS